MKDAFTRSSSATRARVHTRAHTVMSRRAQPQQPPEAAATQPNFLRYLRENAFASNPRAFFAAWPVESMQQEHLLWEPNSLQKCFYVIHNEQFRLTTHVGCASDLEHCMTRRQKRHQSGQWQLIFYAVVPPLRNWRIEELRRHANGKGLALRTQRLLSKAHAMHLDWRLASETLDSESPLYMPELVETLRALAILRDADSLRQHLIDAPSEARLQTLVSRKRKAAP